MVMWGGTCSAKSDHARPATWFINCIQCRVLYVDEYTVSILHVVVRHSVGLVHDGELRNSSIKRAQLKKNEALKSKLNKQILVG